jgi:periplasmic glucans biosynthesis protein
MRCEGINRRELVLAIGGLAVGVIAKNSLALTQEATEPFNRDKVVELARTLATKEFDPPSEVPELFGKLGYDQYRDIRFRPELGFWTGEHRGFSLDFLHAGFIYKSPVEVYVVEAGTSIPVRYTTRLFDFGRHLKVPPLHDQALFSGIRLRAPIHTPDRMDEFVVFQGASYFRALGAGQNYGVSARGLAVNTAEPSGEEFPAFRALWVERPERGAKAVAVHALLDSPSVTGAYTFLITPGKDTLMDVEATLFARRDLSHVGIAPLTSMYFFASPEAHRFDDYRPRVHDSDTLAIAQKDDWLSRPLANPRLLQVSGFQTTHLRGFGLQQRARAYTDYKDLEARYELRPSVWVEPKEDWGEGQVELIEIPSDREFNDNIVAFWRPAQPLAAGESETYSYWLRWGIPFYEKQLARVIETSSGLSLDHARRLFIIDFAAPEAGFFAAEVQPQVFASQGTLKNIVGQRNVLTGGYRVSFELDVSGADLAELRLFLILGDQTISETWLYRWTR